MGLSDSFNFDLCDGVGRTKRGKRYSFVVSCINIIKRKARWSGLKTDICSLTTRTYLSPNRPPNAHCSNS